MKWAIALITLPAVVLGQMALPCGAEQMIVRRHMTHTIPLIHQDPVVDGVVDLREWIGAAALPGLLDNATGETDCSQRTAAYIAYTSQRLFLAWKVYRTVQQGPMRIQHATPGNVGGVWGDDCVELQFDIGKTGRVAVNFAGNAAGAFSDGLAEPAVDPSRSWPWQYQARMTDFGWEAELSIAFKDLGVDGTPTAGTVWGFDFVRNEKTPEERVFYLSYRYNWHDIGKYSRLVFGGSTPAIRFGDCGPIGEQSIGVLADIVNLTPHSTAIKAEYRVYRRRDGLNSVNFLYEVDSGVADKNEAGGFTLANADEQIASMLASYELLADNSVAVTVFPNQRRPVKMTVDDCPVATYVIACRFTDANGRVLSSTLLPVTKADPLDLKIVPYYLGRDVIFVKASLANPAVSKIVCQLVQGGHVLAETAVPRQAAICGIDLPTQDVALGSYQVRADGFDATGQVISHTEKRMVRPERPWWAVRRAGTKTFVPKPWTAVQADDRSCQIWGRRYAFADGVFPASMISLGEELFASPPRIVLTIQNKQVPFEGSITCDTRDDEYVQYTWRGIAGSIPVKAVTRVEFDGFVTVDLEMAAKGVMIDSLRIEFSLNKDIATLYTINSDQAKPGGFKWKGQIDTKLSTSFCQAVWVGNEQRGFQWCAESNQYWHNANADNALAILPRPQAVLLRLNIIDTPYRAAETLRYRLGLNATPVKPYPTAYRKTFFFQSSLPKLFPEDPEQVQAYCFGLDFARALGATHYNAISWQMDPYCQPVIEDDRLKDRLRKAADMAHHRGLKMVLYTGWNGGSPRMSFWPFFGQEIIRTPKRYSEGGYGQCPRGGYDNYLANGIAQMVTELGIDGVYLDSTAWPVPCNDRHHGCGYADPTTGRRVVTRNLWSTREMFKRIYKIMHGEVIDDGLVYGHAGQSPLLAIEAFVDIKHMGEGIDYAKSLTNFFETIDGYRAAYNPTQYGLPVEHPYHGKGVAGNALWGVALLHDNVIKMYPDVMLPYYRKSSYEGDANTIAWRLWAPRKWFQWSGNTWHPYYANGDLLSVQEKDAYASFHINDKKQILLFAMNMSNRDRTVHFAFNAQQLDLPTTLYARDAVTNDTIEIHQARLSLDMLAERPRVLMIDHEEVPEVALNLPIHKP